MWRDFVLWVLNYRIICHGFVDYVWAKIKYRTSSKRCLIGALKRCPEKLRPSKSLLGLFYLFSTHFRTIVYVHWENLRRSNSPLCALLKCIGEYSLKLFSAVLTVDSLLESKLSSLLWMSTALWTSRRERKNAQTSIIETECARDRERKLRGYNRVYRGVCVCGMAKTAKFGRRLLRVEKGTRFQRQTIRTCSSFQLYPTVCCIRRRPVRIHVVRRAWTQDFPLRTV
jgi:hypothetical protein